MSDDEFVVVLVVDDGEMTSEKTLDVRQEAYRDVTGDEVTDFVTFLTDDTDVNGDQC